MKISIDAGVYDDPASTQALQEEARDRADTAYADCG